jgi:tRNA(Ile)-lysidine synthase
LGFRRAELRAYLDDIGQPYRVDATNLDPRRTRNRLRHQLLPELETSFNCGVVDALLRLGGLAGELQVVVDGIVEPLLDSSLKVAHPGEVLLASDSWTGTSRYVLRELFMALWRRQGWPLRHMGFAEWDSLAAMVTGGEQGERKKKRGDGRREMGDRDIPRRRMLPGGILADWDGASLRLRRIP